MKIIHEEIMFIKVAIGVLALFLVVKTIFVLSTYHRLNSTDRLFKFMLDTMNQNQERTNKLLEQIRDREYEDLKKSAKERNGGPGFGGVVGFGK